MGKAEVKVTRALIEARSMAKKRIVRRGGTGE